MIRVKIRAYPPHALPQCYHQSAKTKHADSPVRPCCEARGMCQPVHVREAPRSIPDGRQTSVTVGRVTCVETCRASERRIGAEKECRAPAPLLSTSSGIGELLSRSRASFDVAKKRRLFDRRWAPCDAAMPVLLFKVAFRKCVLTLGTSRVRIALAVTG
jgi:hypothetical protein